MLGKLVLKRGIIPVRRIGSSVHTNITRLEDLAKLKSLDNVNPELIRKLINERTNELNIDNELKMLNSLQREEKNAQEITFKKFVRPIWVFFIMSSIVYLSYHLLWWKLEYDELEMQFNNQIKKLESELNGLIESNKQKNQEEGISNVKYKKKWYKFW